MHLNLFFFSRRKKAPPNTIGTAKLIQTSIQEQISLTTKLLNDGEKVTQNQKDLIHSEIVLILGKAGSGKTSLVQFLTENPKRSQKKSDQTPASISLKMDGEKIGTSATESFTLYPELVYHNSSSIALCDSPGFHDSRSSAHEIVSMDFMKSVTSKFKKVKILLLETHGSLQYGVLKDSFLNTLRHLTDFLVDIDRYKDQIVLIATKIPLTYVTTDDINVVSGIVTDEMHIESIMDYLNHTESSIAEKLNQNIGKSNRDFYQKVIKLLRSLQTRDENGKAKRINVFRRPYKSGSLTNMSLLEKNKKSLTKTIMGLDSVQVKMNDFDFTLSDTAKLYLECLLKLTNDNYKNKINGLSFRLDEYLNQKTQNFTSYHQVLLDLELLHNAMEQLLENLDETNNYNEFFTKVNHFISEQKISSQINFHEQIHVLEKYEDMLLRFVNTNLVFTLSLWTLPIRQVMKSVEDELHWYRSLNKYIGRLASYKTQKNKTEILSTLIHGASTSSDDLMDLFVSNTGNTIMKQFIDAKGNTKRQLELVTITKTLVQQSNITCDANGRLVVKGFHIRISEVNLEELVQHYCNNITVKDVAFLAVETVFLDEDTVDIFKGVNVFIAAPKWEVIGQRRIVISGKAGPNVSDNEPYVANGKDGKPGLPGGNGGSFFGIGLQFLNGQSLRIESNGGAGGAGAKGAKGAKGLDGMNASQKLKLGMVDHRYKFDRGMKTGDVNNSLTQEHGDRDFEIAYCGDYVYAEVQVINEDGDCGGRGSTGGFGGEGGIGGFPGDQQLIELGDSSHIEMQNQIGSMGERGSIGETGDRGTDGIGMICVQVKRKGSGHESSSYWKCESTNIIAQVCNTCQNPGEAFEYQYTTSGIEQASTQKVC
ncbi:hypothetical protein LSTR_LSTR017148 [Laodelphax striatellus]|uniref:Uncharacterized protein n=1 Tax=Laodelphax striatellus TaxID=195883 RepID=A0A482WWM9_LAOST|nr:hypothetical protein LSTR_LSTR017148 [Laodelphax striatellus]